MAEVSTTYHGKCVRDVPAEAFIKAFSAYLKSTGKVWSMIVLVCVKVLHFHRCQIRSRRNREVKRQEGFHFARAKR
jgi:ribosomal protein S19E (S16A)